MIFRLNKKQSYFAQIILATLLFASAAVQSIRHGKIVNEQISSRINDALVALVEQNEATVYDWASWDDTVELAQKRYDSYFADNFNEDTSRIIQLAIVIDEMNKPVSGEIWNAEANSFRPLETKGIETIVKSFQACGSSFTVALSELYLISSSFISPTDSNTDLLTYGCLYFGKRLPDSKLSDIFASMVNNSSLNVKKISIQPSLSLEDKLNPSRHSLAVQGSRSGLFGSNVIIMKNQPILSFYLLLILGLYGSLVTILTKDHLTNR